MKRDFKKAMKQRAAKAMHAAQRAVRMHRYIDALRHYQKALKSMERLGSKLFLTEIHMKMAEIYREIGQDSKALEAYQWIAAHSPNAQWKAFGASQAAMGLIDKAKFEEAEIHLRQALEYFEAQQIPKAEAMQWGNLSIIFKQQGKYQEAITCLERAQEAYQRAEDTEGLSHVLCTLGEIQKLQGQWDAAQQSFQKAWEMAKGNHLELQAYAQRSLGQVYAAMGFLREALETYVQAKEIHHRLKDKRGESAAYLDMGVVQFHLGQWQEALKSLEQAMSLARAEHAFEIERLILNAQIDVEIRMGKLREAQKHLIQAEAMAQKSGDPMAWAALWSAQAGLAIARGAWTEAQVLLEKLSTEGQVNARYLPNIHGMQGKIAYGMGKLRKASHFFESAAQGYAELGEVRKVETAQLHRILTDIELMEWEGLEEEIRVLLASAQKRGEKSWEGEVWECLGEWQRAVKQFREAEHSYLKAEALFKEAHNVELWVSTRHAQVDLHCRGHRHLSDARVFLREARLEIEAHGWYPKLLQNRLYGIQVALVEGDFKGAAQDLEAMEEGLELYPLILGKYKHLQALFYKHQGKEKEAEALYTQAKTLYQKLEAKLHQRDLEEDWQGASQSSKD